MTEDPEFPPFEEGDHIYFVDVHTLDTVHLQAYGFTRFFHLFAAARSIEEAEKITAEYCESKGVRTKKTTAKDAIQQDPTKYVFPEQFIRRKNDV